TYSSLTATSFLFLPPRNRSGRAFVDRFHGIDLGEHLLIGNGVRVRLDAECDRAPIGTLDEAGEAVHPVDAPRLRDHPSLDRGAGEALQQGARLPRMR